MLNMQVREQHRYIDCAVSWIVSHGSIPGRGKTFFFSSQPPDWLWGVCSLLCNAYLGSLPRHEDDHSPACNVKEKNVWSCMYSHI
jgi:hypothetical protein